MFDIFAAVVVMRRRCRPADLGGAGAVLARLVAVAAVAAVLAGALSPCK